MSRLAAPTRHPFVLGWLTVVWVGLWGSATAANVLGGIAVAAGLLVLLPLPATADSGRGSLAGALRFAGVFVVELVKASLVVVVQVLRPRTVLSQAVLRVEVPGASDRLLALAANAISLTPGTLTVEVDRGRDVLYVHALDVGGPQGVEQARRSIARLVRLAALAVGPRGVADRMEVSPR